MLLPVTASRRTVAMMMGSLRVLGRVWPRPFRLSSCHGCESKSSSFMTVPH